jgi:hypothetical protein
MRTGAGRVTSGVLACLLVAPVPMAAAAGTDTKATTADDRATASAPPWVAAFTPPGLHEAPPTQGVRRTETIDGPSARWFFAIDRVGEHFEPAPAPDLFVGEPDYGDTDAALVNLAAGTLGQPTPLGLDDDEIERLLADARRELDPALALTGVDLSTEGLLEAARKLAPEASADPWHIDPAQLVAATGRRLEPALATFGVGADVGNLADRVRAALERAALPTDITTAQLARLQSRAQMARAEASYAGPGQLTVSSPTAITSLAQYRTLSVSTPVGPIQAHLVTVPLDDPALELATRRSTVWDRRASVVDAASAHGLRIAVNGGFWTAGGDPDGLLVDGGDLQSDTTAGTYRVRGVRAGFGIRSDGKPVVGRPDVGIFVHTDGGTTLVQGVNRRVGDSDVVLFTGSGPDPTIPQGAQVWRITPARPDPDLTNPGTIEVVSQPADAGQRPDRSSYLLVATNGQLGSRPASLEVTTRAGWESLHTALAAGPALMENGDVLGVSRWRAEGFPATHTDVRHPRTAIGFDRFGATFLLVIDGRQPAYSVGATQTETSAIMQAFGVHDAVMLDGGGSTQLVIDGALVNRPCCDSPVRAVATVVGFRSR